MMGQLVPAVSSQQSQSPRLHLAWLRVRSLVCSNHLEGQEQRFFYKILHRIRTYVHTRSHTRIHELTRTKLFGERLNLCWFFFTSLGNVRGGKCVRAIWNEFFSHKFQQRAWCVIDRRFRGTICIVFRENFHATFCRRCGFDCACAFGRVFLIDVSGGLVNLHVGAATISLVLGPPLI